MQRTLLSAIALAIATTLTACNSDDNTPRVDLQLDSINNHRVATDPTIFDNHADFFRRAPAPAPATPAATEETPATETTEGTPSESPDDF